MPWTLSLGEDDHPTRKVEKMRFKLLIAPCVVLCSVALPCLADGGAASGASADPLGGSSASTAHASPSAAKVHNYLLNINPGGFTYNLTVQGANATTVNTVSGDVEHYQVVVHTKKGKKHVKFSEVGGGFCVLKGVQTPSGYNTASSPGVAVCNIGSFSWYATKA
jgi:hypothetical protein